MEKITLYRDNNGNVRCNFRGMDMPLEKLNISLLAQVYKQTGFMPDIGFPADDFALSAVANQLEEKIRQTAMMLL